jgi:hypothetical protein
MFKNFSENRGRTIRRGSAVASAVVESLESRRLLSAAYSFDPLAYLGDPAPGGGQHVNDFEVGSLNNSGTVAVVSDLSAGGEGAFLAHSGRPRLQVTRSGAPAPGGPVGASSFGRLAVNDVGNSAVTFGDPTQSPVGLGGVVYRSNHAGGPVSAVEIPGVTPVPDSSGVFRGAYVQAAINNRGTIAFTGMVDTQYGVHIPGETYLGLGLGIYEQSSNGNLSRVVAPGDAAPGGSTFDTAENPWINARGDVAFEGHVVGDELITGGNPQTVRLFAADGAYVKNGKTGVIRVIAHTGDAAPGGGTFRHAWGPVVNDHGQVLFVGDLTAAPANDQILGLFLKSGGKTVAVVRPGDAMPGGGHIYSTSDYTNDYGLNEDGSVSFSAALDTFHTEVVGGTSTQIRDTGVYVVSDGVTQLVARSGTVIPGVGTVNDLENTQVLGANSALLFGGAVINDPGQVALGAILTDGRNVLLIANPGHQGHDGQGDDNSQGNLHSDGASHQSDSSSDKKHEDDDVLGRSGRRVI